VQNQNKKGK